MSLSIEIFLRSLYINRNELSIVSSACVFENNKIKVTKSKYPDNMIANMISG